MTRAEADVFRKALLFGRLTDGHAISLQAFKCGTKEVDDYLPAQALDDTRRQRAITWIFTHDADLVGYITLSFVSIKLGAGEREARGLMDRPVTWPGLLIGWLGVDLRYQHRGVGQELLNFALGRALIHGRDAACRVLVADVNQEERTIKMYREFGFEPCTHSDYQSAAQRGTPRYFYDCLTTPQARLGDASRSAG
jgi:GNAT superfamily N-acetyltransferase